MSIFIWVVGGIIGAVFASDSNIGVAFSVWASTFITGLFFYMLKQIIELLTSIDRKLDIR